MSKAICKHCFNFESDPNASFCQCVPYPCPVDDYCVCYDPDGCSTEDLVDCPSCIFALKSRYCVLGHTGAAQSDCPHYQSSLV